MTRSHVLLHCPNERLNGSVRRKAVLLANPKWERRLLRFLEPSGAGRVVADGTNEDEVNKQTKKESLQGSVSVLYISRSLSKSLRQAATRIDSSG
jgi:hypothetical protein